MMLTCRTPLLPVLPARVTSQEYQLCAVWLVENMGVLVPTALKPDTAEVVLTYHW